MTDSLTIAPRVYTDIQGLSQLSYGKDKVAAKKEVAAQFEAILMQMVLHSMRDANKSFGGDGLFGGQQMDMYQDMFDKQLTMVMSQSSNGFAKIVEKSIDQLNEPHKDSYESNSVAVRKPAELAPLSSSVKTVSAEKLLPEQAASPDSFLKRIWSSAKQAAIALGTGPEVLLAQAVLETNWGKSIISHANTQSTHNLFNIKADAEWKQKSVSVNSLEERNHVLIKEKSSFKSYESYEDSFKDYVQLLKQNSRYKDVLQAAASPEKFINALQHAGFATDSNYATKVLNVLSSSLFKSAIAHLK